jgi:hypothetical protein
MAAGQGPATTGDCHGSLRCSPAMAAGISQRLWDIGDIVTVIEDWEVRWTPSAGQKPG